jgi:hypothetical protein
VRQRKLQNLTVFIEWLLYTRHCAQSWRYHHEQDSVLPTSFLGSIWQGRLKMKEVIPRPICRVVVGTVSVRLYRGHIVP